MRFTNWGGGPLEGTVRVVEPSGFTKVSALGVEEQRVNVIADLRQLPEGLGDRFRVELAIVVWQDTSVVPMPASTVFRRGEGWAAWAVEEGRARLREVRLGHRTPLVVEVTGGLAPGALVIRSPGDRVRDGVKVRASVTPS